MEKKRIIARLDIKGPNVIKGIQFDGLRVMGKPGELAFKYYQQNADELIYIDTVASLYERNNLMDIVKRAGEHIFVPMTVGGGIRSVEDARQLLYSGADKVAINTAAVNQKELISKIANALGSQAVVVSLEVKKSKDSKWEIYVENGREKTGIDALEWAREAERMGAGELLVTSVDRDGTESGFDIDFMKLLDGAVAIPVIAAGGAGCIEDIIKVIKETNVDAVAIGSVLHYEELNIREIKRRLHESNILVVEH